MKHTFLCCGNGFSFIDFIKQNKEKIYKFAENNTPKNEQGIPVIKEDDEWRNEPEWND